MGDNLQKIAFLLGRGLQKRKIRILHADLSQTAESPQHRMMIVQRNLEDIAQSDDATLLKEAVEILAEDRNYNALIDLLHKSYPLALYCIESENAANRLKRMGVIPACGESLRDRRVPQFLRDIADRRWEYIEWLLRDTLTPEQRVEYAQFLLHKYDDPSFFADEIIDVTSGLAQARPLLGTLARSPEYVRRRPVSSVKLAVELEDYDAVGRAFGELRKGAVYTWNSHEHPEIRELRENILGGPEVLEKIHDRTLKKRRKKVTQAQAEFRDAYGQLLQGLDGLLMGMSDPKRAFASVGDYLMELRTNVNSERDTHDLRLAVEYHIKSGDPERVMQSSQRALNHEGDYEDKRAAYLGFRTLLGMAEVSEELKEQARHGMRAVFENFWTYQHMPSLAIEAAEMLGDFSFVKTHFLQSPRSMIPVPKDVFEALKERQLIQPSEVIQAANEYLLQHMAEGNGDLRAALDMAGLVPELTLPRETIVSCIMKTRNRDCAKAAMQYLSQKNLMRPEDKVLLKYV
ncbi:hypothetical protein J4464_06405 [Candidatus Woesearchaeota archaeon]|nr:hypothetical protein [Candidatus Woesearchaeota archaeon]